MGELNVHGKEFFNDSPLPLFNDLREGDERRLVGILEFAKWLP